MTTREQPDDQDATVQISRIRPAPSPRAGDNNPASAGTSTRNGVNPMPLAEARARRARPCSIILRVPQARSPSASTLVAATSPLPGILTFVKERGWRRLRLLSSVGNNLTTATISPIRGRDRRC